MVLLGCVAVFAWLGFGFSDTYVLDLNCGTNMNERPMPDDLTAFACKSALDSRATTTGFVAMAAMVFFAVAVTIHLTSKSKI